MLNGEQRGTGVDVVVIGAGQAGLAMGYYLAQAGVRVQLLERAEHVGTSCAGRWDSLRLFIPPFSAMCNVTPAESPIA